MVVRRNHFIRNHSSNTFVKAPRKIPSPTEIIANSVTRNNFANTLFSFPSHYPDNILESLTAAMNTLLDDSIQEFLEPIPHVRNRDFSDRLSTSRTETQNKNSTAETNKPSSSNKNVEDDYWNLWLENIDFFRRYCHKLLFNFPHEVEDVLSMTMIKGSQAYSGSTIQNGKAWLTRLLHNNCMDVLRYVQKQQDYVQLPQEEEGEINGNIPPSTTGRPHDSVSYLQLVKELIDTLESLPNSLKEPFILRFIELSYEDISDELKLNNCTVRKRVQLARKAIKERLQEYL